MKVRAAGLAALLVAPVVTGLAGTSSAQEVRIGQRLDAPTLVRDPVDPLLHVPRPWETPDLRLPLLSDDAVVATSEDDDQLRFVTGDELGTFRPAPEGGSVFFGAGQPIFGLAAPPLLPSRVLRPLGSGDTGDRFLGERPPIDPTTVIPKLDETFDSRRESFAFLDGPPPIVDRAQSGTTPFPLVEQVEADPIPGVPDNIPVDPPDEPGPPDTTPPVSTPPTFTPGPRPTVPPTTRPTTRPTPTTAPAPGTTVPRPRPTTSTTVATTTTTSTTSTTSTTTTSTTSTTSTTTTTTTTTVPAPLPPPVTTTALVMGNTVEDRDTCFANDPDGPQQNDCDRLFEIDDARPGQTYRVDLTIWNVDPDSDTTADLRVFANSACQNGTNGPAPWGSNANLCGAVEMSVARYTSSSRATLERCIYGVGAGCSLGAGRNFGHFSSTHTTMASGAQIDPSFVPGERAYLVLLVRLPDRGFDATGRGRDNEYMGRTASVSFRWRMDQ